MINCLNLYIPPKNYKLWEMHLLEHYLAEMVSTELRVKGLDKSGVIIDAETFLDGVNIYVYYSNMKLKSKILSILLFSIDTVTSNFNKVQDEYYRLKNEIKETNSTEEEYALYHPLKKQYGNNLNDLEYVGELEDFSIIKCEEYSITLLQESLLTVISNRLSSNSTQQKSPIFSTQGNYYVGAFQLQVSSLKEFVISHFLSFSIGMSEISILPVRYATKYDVYLAYSTITPQYSDLSLHFLVSSNGKGIETIEEILTESVIKNEISDRYEELLASFHTFILLNLSCIEVFKQLSKLNIQSKEIITNVNDVFTTINHLTMNDIEKFIEKNWRRS